MGTVYILESIFDNDRIYKIGITKRNVSERLRELKTGNVEGISCIFEYKSDFYTSIESTLHRLYSHKRINGEWFTLTPSELIEVKDRCRVIESNLNFLMKQNNKFL